MHYSVAFKPKIPEWTAFMISEFVDCYSPDIFEGFKYKNLIDNFDNATPPLVM